MKDRSMWRRSCSLAGAFCLVLFAAANAEAQGQRGRIPSKPQLQELYKQKLESPFIKKIPWVRTIAEAQKLSKEKKLPIFGYFTRSYGP